LGDAPSDAGHDWARDDVNLILDILGQARVTFWAGAGAEKDYAIRLWNPGAERIYGHSRDEALGKSYIDLFVNPRERTRALEDHERIVRTGEVYEWDWAADDLTRGKKVRTMLTHCFRVRDPEDGSWLLAEMGIDISDFTRATQQLRLLREDDFERREMTLAYAVGEIGQAVTQVGLDGSVETVAQKVFEAAKQAVTGVGRCTMWLLDGEGPDRLDDDEASVKSAYKEDEARQHVTETGTPVFFDTNDKEPDGLELSVGGRRGRKRSFAVLPLRTFHSSQLGVLGVSLTSGKRFTKRDRERLESVAAFSGPLLSVAQELQRRREERTRRLEVQTKQKVFESVLHSVGNNVFELRGLVESMGNPDLRPDVPNDIRELLAALRDKAENLNTSLAALKRDVESEDQPEQVSILDASNDLVNRLRISHPGVRFSVDATESDSALVVRVWLNHILENIVTNAVQVMEQWVGGGTVRVSAVTGEGHIDIHVEDDGPGVDPTIRATLFERGVTRRAGGGGEGLAIASEFAARSSGSIRLLPENSELGGAHFCVTLPSRAGTI
jgi:PAS domain S-box-containing protein